MKEKQLGALKVRSLSAKQSRSSIFEKVDLTLYYISVCLTLVCVRVCVIATCAITTFIYITSRVTVPSRKTTPGVVRAGDMMSWFQ